MLRIALVSTVYKRTPPSGYGGIERVVHILAQELCRRGNRVTLFATPGSQCDGEVVELTGYDPNAAPSGRTVAADFLSEEPLYQAMVERLDRDEFDVVHDFSFENLFVSRHPERFPFVVSVCTPVDPARPRRNLVACSELHARSIGPDVRFVHYGLDLSEWQPGYDKQAYLVHIAKIAPYKGQHESLAAAALARRELRIVGNVEHRSYHRLMVDPLIRLVPRASYLGEASSTRDVLLPARALVQTPRWFDAFPLVIVEAMACGTPVIAYGEGGIPEQIEHGVNGLLCDGVRELARMMRKVDGIDPRACRAHAERHFTVGRMADQYLELYRQAIGGTTW